jgi:pimeloyl-ACP methyl ester carboxylesterase
VHEPTISATRLPVLPDPLRPWPGRQVQTRGGSVFVRHTPWTGPVPTPTSEPDDASTAGGQPTDPPRERALYVHGLGGAATNWTDMAGLLAVRFDGYALDLPGFGQSEPPARGGYSIQQHVQAVVDVLEWIADQPGPDGRGDAAVRRPVHLVGNSLGGSISVRVAGLRPDLVRTLTLVSPAMPFLDPRRTAQLRVLPVLALPSAEKLFAWGMGRMSPERMAEQVLAACFGDPAKSVPQRRAEAIEEIKLRYTVEHYPRAYLQTLRGLVASFVRAYLPGPNSLWRLAARVTAPTLIIGGTTDRLIDVRVPAQVARTIPDSRLLTLPGVGHVPQMEEPRMVARAIAGLLDEVSAAAPGR